MQYIVNSLTYSMISIFIYFDADEKERAEITAKKHVKNGYTITEQSENFIKLEK